MKYINLLDDLRLTFFFSFLKSSQTSTNAPKVRPSALIPAEMNPVLISASALVALYWETMVTLATVSHRKDCIVKLLVRGLKITRISFLIHAGCT